MDTRHVLVAKISRRRFGHPHRDAESLAARSHQVVGGRWSPAPLTNPQRLTYQRVERVVDACVLSIRILLTACTKSLRFLLVIHGQPGFVPHFVPHFFPVDDLGQALALGLFEG